MIMRNIIDMILNIGRPQRLKVYEILKEHISPG